MKKFAFVLIVFALINSICYAEYITTDSRISQDRFVFGGIRIGDTMGNGINLSDTVIKANWINITAISLKESVVS